MLELSNKDFKITKFNILKDLIEKVDMLNRQAISAKSWQLLKKAQTELLKIKKQF